MQMYYLVKSLVFAIFVFKISYGNCSDSYEYEDKVECAWPTSSPNCHQDPVGKVKVRQITSVFVSIEWSGPESWNCSGEGYLICYKGGGTSTGPLLLEGPDETQFKAGSLNPWTNYELSLKAYSWDGAIKCVSVSRMLVIQTQMTAPSAPGPIYVSQTTPHVISVRWGKPETLNGPLSGYLLTLSPNETPFNATTKGTEYTFRDLTPWTEYYISIAAYNTKDDGQIMYGLAVTTSHRTDMSKPGPVTNLRFSNVTSTSVLIEWEEPEVKNGPVSGYFVSLYRTGDVPGTLIRTTLKYFSASSLTPYTNYVFVIDAFNTKPNGEMIQGDNSTASSMTQLDRPSAPLNLQFGKVTTTTMEISWSEPQLKNGPISGYILNYTSDHQDYVTHNTSDLYFELNGLSPWTNYSVAVAAFNTIQEKYLVGKMTSDEKTTDSGVPSVPVSLSAAEVTSTSVAITWSAPKVPNGPITGYQVTCVSDDTQLMDTTSETGTSFTSLRPWSSYTLSVAAYNNGTAVHTGPNENITVTTYTAAPGVPGSVRVLKVTNSTINIQWDKPQNPNGPVEGYFVSVHDGIKIETRVTKYTFKDLDPWTTYNISVSAFNLDTKTRSIKIEGDLVRVETKTKESAPPFPKNISILEIGEKTITFQVPFELFSPLRGPITDYVLLVAKKGGMGELPEIGYDGISHTQFKSWKDAKDWGDMYRTSPIGWSPETGSSMCQKVRNGYACAVGSQTNCTVKIQFCNGPLKPTTPYRVKIRGYTRNGWSETKPIEMTTGGSPMFFPGKVLMFILVLFCLRKTI